MEELLIGVDDAGRGCVIGNMVLAGCLINSEIEPELRELGAKDSKLLTPKQRDELAIGIKEKVIQYEVFMATPSEIDTGMGEGLNLNQVEAFGAANIINILTKDLSSVQRKNLKIILDCPSINTNGWKNQLLEYVTEKNLSENIICEHKADFNHVVVSAASIIAKTTRDAEIEKIKKEIGINFGSGYPSDPFTVEFLKKHALDFKKERIFRESWSTWQKAAGVRSDFFRKDSSEEKDNKTKKQKNLGEF